MTRFLMLFVMGLLASPTVALAAEHNAGYRGIGYIYFSFIAAVLIYGVYAGRKRCQEPFPDVMEEQNRHGLRRLSTAHSSSSLSPLAAE